MAIQTVQKTAKKYKAASMLGKLLCVVGAICIIVEMLRTEGEGSVPTAFIVILVLGIVLAAGASFLAWWHHG